MGDVAIIIIIVFLLMIKFVFAWIKVKIYLLSFKMKNNSFLMTISYLMARKEISTFLKEKK